MINKENIEKWASALESGDYEQAYGVLRFDDSYCVWGVACDVSDMGDWVIFGVTEDNEVMYAYEDTTMHTHKAPHSVSNWLGISPTVRDVIENKNDSGESFKDLANYIRKLS